MSSALNALRLAISGPSGINKGIELSIKNSPTGNYLKHNTNWEYDINSSDFRSKSFLNSIGSSSISYTNTDFSDHYYDHYGNEKGLSSEDYRNSSYPSIPTVYTFENSWEPNDLALLDDIAVVGIKDYCPVSKQTWTFNSKISQYHYGRIDIPPDAYCQELMSTAYNYQSGDAPEGYSYFGVLISINDSSYGTVDVTTYKCNGDVDQTLTFTIPAGASPSYEVIELAVVDSCADVVSEPFIDIQGYAGNAGFNYYGTTNPNPPEPSPAPTNPTDIIFDDGVTTQTPPNIVDNGNNRIPSQTSTIIDNPTLYSCYYDDSAIIETFGETTFVLDVKLGNILNKNTEWSEYIDLSDIFIEVNYDSSQEDSVVKSGKERIIYKFGGYIKDCSSLNGSKYTSITNIKNKNYIDNEGEYYYYIQTPSTESPYNIGLQEPIVVLSSYISLPLPSNVNDYNFKGGPLPCRAEVSRLGYTTSFLPIHGLIVPVTSVKIHQVTVAPKAGKVEVYTRKSGKITAFNYGTLVVPEHNMQDGDIIKISGAFDVDYTLAVWMEDNGFIYEETEAYYLMLEDFKNNLNNVKYVKVVDENAVQIFEDKELTKIITVPINLSFQSDLVWTCIGNATDKDNQGWGFYSSLSSPSGRNGYTRQSYRKYESFDKPQPTNIVFDGYSQDSIKQLIDSAESYNPSHFAPFSYGNSWNNYYPLKRYPDDNITNLGLTTFGNGQSSLLKLLINNGNNFGCSVDLKKYTDNEYILSIGEPGATDSFKILNQYEIDNSDNPSSYGQYCPVNVRVIPKYLPYGRVHFYKITKNSYGGIRQIDYLNTIIQENHPWKTYETLNLSKTLDSYDYRYYATINYPIKSSEILDNITLATLYWNGASYISWNKNYIYQQGVGNRPDLFNNKIIFAFLDRFGKSLSIDPVYSDKAIYFSIASDIKYGPIQSTSIYTIISFGYLPLYSNLPIFEVKQLQYNINSPIDQIKSEVRNFANKIVYKDSKIFFGWSNTYKPTAYLYYYKRDSGQHTLTQIVENTQSFTKINSTTNSTSSTSFGKFISYDGEYLITNGMCSETEDGVETGLPLDYLYIYKYNHLFDQFNFLQKLSATIDLSNPKYNSLASNLYVETTNYSYDRTKDNSATYISNLSGKYDIYGNALILRDPLEYILYIYSATENKFVPRFHAFSRVDGLDYVKQIVKTDNSVIKMSRSQTPATLDSKTVFDNGQFSKSYQIIDFSNFIPEKSGYYSSGELLSSFTTTNFTEKNVGTAIDFLDPTYGLNLYIKTKSESSGVANLFTRGYDSITGSMPLFLKLQIEIAKSGVNLFAKQIDVSNSGLNLSIKPHEIYNSGITLFTEAGKTSNMPLYVGYIIPTTGVDGSQDLVLYNEYQGGVAGGPGTDPSDPNYESQGTVKSGVYPLFIQSELYDDMASSFDLFIGEQPVQIDPDTGQPVVPVNATEYQTTNDLYISGPEYIYVPGTGSSGVFNLYIGNNQVYSDLDLVVYNTVAATGLNLYTDCKYHAVSGITIFTSGYTIPSSTMTLYQRGYIPYG